MDAVAGVERGLELWDPIASAANLAELRAIISPFGFRRAARLHEDELRRLTVPTLVVWGDHDSVAGADAARTTARLIPSAQLEVLPGGHVPYLGNPDRVAELVSGAVRAQSAPARPAGFEPATSASGGQRSIH